MGGDAKIGLTTSVYGVLGTLSLTVIGSILGLSTSSFG